MLWQLLSELTSKASSVTEDTKTLESHLGPLSPWTKKFGSCHLGCCGIPLKFFRSQKSPKYCFYPCALDTTVNTLASLPNEHLLSALKSRDTGRILFWDTVFLSFPSVWTSAFRSKIKYYFCCAYGRFISKNFIVQVSLIFMFSPTSWCVMYIPQSYPTLLTEESTERDTGLSYIEMDWQTRGWWAPTIPPLQTKLCL